MLEFLFELFGELLLQLVFEVLGRLGLRAIREPFRGQPNPFLATLGYILFGAVAGALSLWAFPGLFIASHAGRIVNVVVTPLIAGGCMAAIGMWRRERGQDTILLDRFAYGYLFALVMSLVRLRFGG